MAFEDNESHMNDPRTEGGDDSISGGSRSSESKLPVPDDNDAQSSILLGEVLKRVNEGDSVAANKIYQKFGQQLICLAASHISKAFNSKFDPEDIVQSVFCSFFVRQSKDTLKFEKWNDLWSFLYCVTLRKCYENTRKLLANKRSVNRETSLNNLGPEGMAFEGISAEPTAYQVAVFNEMVDQLLVVLRPKQREMLKLKLDGHTNEEVAERVERTARSVYRLLDDLRARARELFGNEEENASEDENANEVEKDEVNANDEQNSNDEENANDEE